MEKKKNQCLRHGGSLLIIAIACLSLGACGEDKPLPGNSTAVVTPTASTASLPQSPAPHSSTTTDPSTSKASSALSKAPRSDSKSTNPLGATPAPQHSKNPSETHRRISTSHKHSSGVKTPTPSLITITHTYTITHTHTAPVTSMASQTKRVNPAQSPRVSKLPSMASPHSTSPAATFNAAADKGGFREDVAGDLKDVNTVPCGGVWRYLSQGDKQYYARELNCAGSLRYFPLQPSAHITLGGKSCSYRGSQDLNYTRDSINSVKWLGNTIIQICVPPGNGVESGLVRLFNFTCG